MVMRIVVASPTLVATFTTKKCILVIFGKFKKRNPRAIGFFPSDFGSKCSSAPVVLLNSSSLMVHSKQSIY